MALVAAGQHGHYKGGMAWKVSLACKLEQQGAWAQQVSQPAAWGRFGRAMGVVEWQGMV